MEQLLLNAETREGTRKHVKQVRADGYVPAVLYGSQVETSSIQIDSKTLHKVLAKAGGNTLISLKIGKAEPVPTLAREIQRDVIRHNIIHVDFLQVVMTEKISAEIPVSLINEAPAVGSLGGILVQGMDFLEVECLPADLPSTIEVDLSPLENFHDTVTVSDLELPSGVVFLSDPDTVVARIEAPRILEEEAEEEEGLLEQVGEVSVEPELVGRRAEDAEEASEE